MGMDVYGKKPKTEEGQYFRSNVWYWRPLWIYCEFIAPQLTQKVEYAQSNDGDGLGSVDARKLGFLLKKSIENGTAQKYIDDYYQFVESAPDEDCYCISSSSLVANVLQLSYVYDGEIPFPKDSPSEPVPNPECHTCNGSGKKKTHFADYHMDINHVSSFANFLMNCGGFQIW